MSVAALVLLAAAGIVWCSQAVRKAERRSGNDLVGYLEASRALYGGGDPYHLPDSFPYIYPLFLAAVVRPLAAAPLPLASVAWFALQAACLWYVLRTASAHAGVEATDRVVAAAAIVAVFGDVVQNEFLNGQVNAIVLALAVGAIHLTERRPHVAALLLGAAIAVKLTPALLLVYWALERRFGNVLESVVWATALIGLPWIIVGDRLWLLYAVYVREFIFARTSSVDPHADAIFFTPYGFWGWLAGSAPGPVLIAGSSLAILAALAAWKLREHARSREQSRSDAWIFAAAVPLLSPMSEVHHLTSLLPAATISAAATPRRPGRLFWAATILFVVFIWIGWADRTGPWYFLSVLSLIGSAVIGLKGANESGNRLLINGASAVRVGRRWGRTLALRIQAARGYESAAGAAARAGRRWGRTLALRIQAARGYESAARAAARAGRRWGWGPTAI